MVQWHVRYLEGVPHLDRKQGDPVEPQLFGMNVSRGSGIGSFPRFTLIAISHTLAMLRNTSFPGFLIALSAAELNCASAVMNHSNA